MSSPEERSPDSSLTMFIRHNMKQRSWSLLSGLLVLCLFAAACSSAPGGEAVTSSELASPSSTSSTTTTSAFEEPLIPAPEVLNGTSWLVVDASGFVASENQTIFFEGPRQASVQFFDNEGLNWLGIGDGCNGHGAAIEWDGYSYRQLTLPPDSPVGGGSTEAGCGEWNSLARTFNGLFGEVSVALDGDQIVLTSLGATVTAVRAPSS